VSQLSLVDLAGSERNNRTQTVGDRLREAGEAEPLDAQHSSNHGKSRNVLLSYDKNCLISIRTNQ